MGLNHTLVQQLLDQGVIQHRSEWGPKAEKDQKSVFWHFRHYPSQMYEPDSVNYVTTRGHCGVCYKEINYKYVCYSKTGGRFTVDWTSPDGTTYDIEYPEKMVCGSTCIHLPEQLTSLVIKCYRELKAQRIQFHDGRILADPLIKSVYDWKVDIFAFPLEWFFFSSKARWQLMLGQKNQKRGLHVEKMYNGTVCQNCANVIKFYRAHEDEERNFINGKIYTPTFLRTADKLFHGTDKFGAIRCIQRIADTDHQTSEPQKYVILTRTQAESLAKEI